MNCVFLITSSDYQDVLNGPRIWIIPLSCWPGPSGPFYACWCFWSKVSLHTLLVSAFVIDPRLGFLAMSLVWQPEELQPGCSITTFAPSPGSNCISTERLPIQLDEDRILPLIRANAVSAIKAETGSGKTMKGPEYLQRIVDPLPVVIVQKSCFAAASVFSSLRDAFDWPEKRLHLKTGLHDTEASFDSYWTQLSIITYGVLFEWFFS
jgi:hypothetical protein